MINLLSKLLRVDNSVRKRMPRLLDPDDLIGGDPAATKRGLSLLDCTSSTSIAQFVSPYS